MGNGESHDPAKARRVTDASELEVGDLLRFDRKLFSHWAVYLGDEEIVHYAADATGSIDKKALFGKTEHVSIRKDGIGAILAKYNTYVNNYLDNSRRPLAPPDIREQAMARLGETSYDLYKNNCEHFATWCRYGEANSGQVNRVDFLRKPIDAIVKAINDPDAVSGGLLLP